MERECLLIGGYTALKIQSIRYFNEKSGADEMYSKEIFLIVCFMHILSNKVVSYRALSMIDESDDTLLRLIAESHNGINTATSDRYIAKQFAFRCDQMKNLDIDIVEFTKVAIKLQIADICMNGNRTMIDINSMCQIMKNLEIVKIILPSNFTLSNQIILFLWQNLSSHSIRSSSSFIRVEFCFASKVMPYTIYDQITPELLGDFDKIGWSVSIQENEQLEESIYFVKLSGKLNLNYNLSTTALKRLKIKKMKREFHTAFFTPTDDTFMDLFRGNQDHDMELISTWCQENEYDSDALYDDLNGSLEWEKDSNLYQLVIKKSINMKTVQLLRNHINKQYHEEDQIVLYKDTNDQHRYKRKYDERQTLEMRTDDGWDNDLNTGFSSVIEANEKQMFERMFSSFEHKVMDKLSQHADLRKKIHSKMNDDVKIAGHKTPLYLEYTPVDDKSSILEKHVVDMMHERGDQVMKQHQKDVQDLNQEFDKSDVLWKNAQKSGMFGWTTDNDRQSQEMTRRKDYESVELQRLEFKHYQQMQQIEKMKQKQLDLLSECKDYDSWQQEFENLDIKNEKRNALIEMIENKIKTTHSKIVFGKYLQNSPFANDMHQEARASDHEITKIARLSQNTLLIDMIDREIATGNKQRNKASKRKSKQNLTEVDSMLDEELQFEIRLNDDWSNWNQQRKTQLQNELANTLGIDISTLTFVSARPGSIIATFKQKIKTIQDSTGFNFDADDAKRDLRQLHDEIYKYNRRWERKVNGCLNYLRNKLDPGDVKEDALYVSQKCVAIIVSHYSKDQTKSVLDGAFLKSDLDKAMYKEVMNPKWDREYGRGPGKTFWQGRLNDGRSRGGDKYQYYCPNGWKRYSVRVDGDFDEKYGDWPICYHGSEASAIGSILSHGIFGSASNAGHLRFFSPSIVYSACPRYALPKMMRDGQRYVQMVFQCRVDPKVMYQCGETMGIERTIQIDYNYPLNYQRCKCWREYANGKFGYSCTKDGHNEIEWFLEGPNIDKYVIYGIMLRFSNDPSELPESRWWNAGSHDWRMLKHWKK